MKRPARATAKASVAALPDTVETMRVSAVLAASLSSELVSLLRRTARLTAPAVPMAKLVSASVKEAVVALLGTAEPVAIFVALAASQASELVTTEPRISRQTASVAKTARRAKGMLRESVAAPLGIAEPKAISAAPVASPALGHATGAPEPSRQTVHVARTVKLAKDMPRASVVRPLDIAAKTPPSAVQAASPPFVHATAAPEASPPMANAAAKTARRARASPRASAAAQTATVAVLPTIAPLGARALLAYATPVPALSQLMELAVARTVESAKALRRGIVAARTATAALRLTIVVPAARTLSGYAAAVRAPSQRMETAPRTARPARARLLETAAVLPTTAAIRPLVAALGGKWMLS